MSKKILVDGRYITREGTGISFYTRELIRVLSLCPEIELTVLDTPDGNAQYRNKIITNYGRENHSTSLLWYSFGLQRQLKRERYDIFHSPAFNLPITSFIKKTVTIHDLTPFLVPEGMPLKFRIYLKYAIINSVRTADRILADSESVKKELSDIFGKEISEKTAVWSPLYRDVSLFRHSIEPKDMYILFIGNMLKRKNLEMLLDIFPHIQEKFSGIKLKIAGISSKGISKPGIEFLGYVDEKQKEELYKKALLLVAPSIYEGFGIPIHEAFFYETPVLASDIQVHRETGGDAAIYFNPRDPDDLLGKMVNLLSDKDLRKTCMQKGIIQLQRYKEDYCPDDLWKIFLQL